MLAETRDSRKWWWLVVAVGAIVRIGAETVEARGEIRKGRSAMESACLCSRSCSSSSIVLMTGVQTLPSAARSAKAETRIGGDTV